MVKIKLDIWKISTFVLLVALIITLYYSNFSSSLGFFALKNNQNANEIGKKVIDYINKNLVQPGTSASLKDVKFDSSLGLYVVTTEYQGNEIPVYVSPNGNFLILGSVLDMSKQLNLASQSQQQIPKSDRPKVELYIFSYCPYGVQAQSAFIEVAKAMKDYADFYVRFFSHMHGEFERQQNMIQECIIRMYPQKYWDYAKIFVEEIYNKCYGNVTCDKEESIKAMQRVGINATEILNCVQTKGSEYYNEDIKLAENLGLTGSPSFVINGVYVSNVVRTPDGIKNVVCQAFNNPPAICNQTLGSSSSVSTAPAGSC
ncbi:MAG: hypothetical protein QW197_00465 [Candidatus Aenigmatarchaeota archaeon]